MTWEEMEFEWRWEMNSKAPKFPVWICFRHDSGYQNFSVFDSVEGILCEPLNLSSPHFDDSERLIDSKGDIYRTEFNGYQIPKLTNDRLTMPLLKRILDETDLEEFERYLKYDDLESFVEINNIK